tara:strand:- start:178 stop:954 length:777 start_codon:yes stop_codon:yes gene_type:complete
MKLETYNCYYDLRKDIDKINTEYILWKKMQSEYFYETTKIKKHNELLLNKLDKLIRKNIKKKCDYWYLLAEEKTKNIKIGITDNFDRRLKEHLDARSKEEIFKDQNHWKPIFVGEIPKNYSTRQFEMLMKLALIYENRDNRDFKNMGPTKKEWFVNNECSHEKLISYFHKHNFQDCELEPIKAYHDEDVEKVCPYILRSFDNVLNKLNIFISDYHKVTRGSSKKYMRQYPDKYYAILEVDNLINSEISNAYSKLCDSV